MQNRVRRPALAAFLVLFASVLVFVSTSAIFADSSRSIVRISFPTESFLPSSIGMIPIEDDLFLVYGAGDEESFAMLFSESGTVLSQVTVPGYVSYPLYSAGQLSLLVPYKSEDAMQSFGIYIYPYALTGQKLVAQKKQDLPWVYTLNRTDFCTDANGRFYAANTAMENMMVIFDHEYSMVQVQETQGDKLRGIAISPDQILYTFYAEDSRIGVLPLPEHITANQPLENPALLESEQPELDFRFLDSRTIMDSVGMLYEVNPNTHLFSSIGETMGDPYCATMLEDGGILVKTEESRAVVLKDGEETSAYVFDGILRALTSNQETAAVLIEQDGDWYFTPVTDRWLEQPDGESSSGSESPDDSSTPGESKPDSSGVDSSQPEPSGNGEITSELFPIDTENQKIYIPQKTTFAMLKKELDIQGAVLRAERPNGVTLASGYAMTGAVLFAESDGIITDSLTVIVPGDLNGSGTVTESSSRILYRVLSGTAELDEATFAAADLDGDGKITTADLLALKKKIQSVS